MLSRLIFGYPDEWKDFERRNAKFLERWPALEHALDTAISREFTAETPADLAIHFLGRNCIEDFMELLLLAANGYGIGALKLLRGLYERAITAAYLAKNPNEATLFLDYRYISRHKMLQTYVESGPAAQEWIDKAEKAKTDFEKVKKNYEVVNCKKCGTRRLNHTWNKLDFVSMAKQTELGILLAQAYYEPLNHAHGTSEALMLRLKQTPSEQIVFRSGPQQNDADRALMVAHAVMVALIGILAEYFKNADIAKQHEQCAQDHVAIWSNQNISIDPTA